MFLEMERAGGVEMSGGARVPIKVCYGVDLSAAWKATTGIGGAIGTATWPCLFCAWHMALRDVGDPGGCLDCGEQCGHCDMFNSEKRARQQGMHDGLERKVDGRGI